MHSKRGIGLVLTILSLHQSCWILNTMPARAARIVTAFGFAWQLHRLGLAMATHAGGQRIPSLHDTAYEAPPVRCIPCNIVARAEALVNPAQQLLAQALPGLPFHASMVASLQQPQSHFLTDFGPDTGLVGSGFGIDPAGELMGQDRASDPNAKRRRAPERRSGARSTSKYRGVTHHCRTGRCVLPFALAISLY